MIKTKGISIDLGGHEIKLKIVDNSEEILVSTINDDETPLWVELWPGALALAKWLWQGPPLEGKSVLELGAGIGLPGIVAGLKEASVLQTDYVAGALELAGENARLNGMADLRTAVADWRDFQITETFDFIIGSDILYHPELNPFLENIFQQNLVPGGQVIMAEAERKDSLAFVKSLADRGWQVEEQRIAVRQGRLDYNIYLFIIQPPRPLPPL